MFLCTHLTSGDRKMKKNYGKNEAGRIWKKKTVITICSVLAVTLFICTAVQPVMAESISSSSSKSSSESEECIPCTPSGQTPEVAECKTCAEAVVHAVDFMKNHVINRVIG